MSGGPPVYVRTKGHMSTLKTRAYVRTKDRSVRLLNLAYVRPKIQIAPLLSLVTKAQINPFN